MVTVLCPDLLALAPAQRFLIVERDGLAVANGKLSPAFRVRAARHVLGSLVVQAGRYAAFTADGRSLGTYAGLEAGARALRAAWKPS